MERSDPTVTAGDRAVHASEPSSPTPAAGPAHGDAACGCTALGDNLAALLAGQMQLISDLASLRYEVTLLAGGTPDQAVAYALAGVKRQRFLMDLDVEGFDADEFESRLRSALEQRASDATPG